MTSPMAIFSKLGLPPLPSHRSDTIAALLWAREVLQQQVKTTYAVKDPQGIEELKPVHIGGMDQWLHIRGRNRHNPVLLFIHGGPGDSALGLMDAIQRPWEDYFTVVQWDQRHSGKSYTPVDEHHPPCLEQYVEDTLAVIQYLRDYLQQDKLFVLGHSWGSVLAMHAVKRRPEWLHAYIGVGQVVGRQAGERGLYERLLQHAKAQQDAEVIARVESILPSLAEDAPPEAGEPWLNIENSGYVRRALSRLAGETLMHHLAWDDAINMFNLDKLLSPHLTFTDLSNAILGDIQVVDIRYDLPHDLGSDFEVPIYFFTGAHDWHTPRSLSDAWFEQISAPHKELIHFEESSHCVMNEEPGKFLLALVTQVLPWAKKQRGSR